MFVAVLFTITRKWKQCRLDNECLVYRRNDVLVSCKEIMKLVGKCMELENIILHETAQTQEENATCSPLLVNPSCESSDVII